MDIARFVVETATASGVCALVGTTLAVTNPTTAAVFGGVMFASGDMTCQKTENFALGYFLGLCASWAACNAIGLPITFKAAIVVAGAATATIIGAILLYVTGKILLGKATNLFSHARA